ncbi:MAG: Asp-tRNA(Asn)/Glu-tRNA(Gln) amidotransferase subunit GatA [Firmicutes bacterium]|nr:Asp-tRNA(Asn)/Glu-tRNA(Gln) amidotransferase subunit GatA [Bacillota bacterium]
MSLYQYTAHELRDMLRRKEVSAAEITDSVLERIDSLDSVIKAYVTVTAEVAKSMAKAVDAQLAQGSDLPELAGIPMGLKDNLNTKGIRTTCSSKMLENYISPYDSTVYEKLIKSMSPLLGKLNMDEFAMGSSTENSAFFNTANPWDLERVPGGSSGGSAAAVAADEAIFTLGSDTGGSIRQPAAFCGVVGLKPTYGRVSRYGLVAFASSLDQIGPITKDVTDAALVLTAIAGHDPMDSTSVNKEVPDYTKFLKEDVKGLKIGLPKEYFVEGIDPEVKTKVMETVQKLEEAGAEVKEISLPHTDAALATYYIIAPAEASSNLARYDGVRYGYRSETAPDVLTMYKKTRSEGFGPEVKRRIMLGTYALSSGYYDAYYLKAQKVRTLIVQDFQKAFEEVDVIVSSTTPTPAFKMGDKIDDPMSMYLSDMFTLPANMAAIPAISVPCGYTEAGLPVGFQIMGPAFGEGTILHVAYAVEKLTGARERRPKLPEKGGAACE